jgi:hypothetical protein
VSKIEKSYMSGDRKYIKVGAYHDGDLEYYDREGLIYAPNKNMFFESIDSAYEILNAEWILLEKHRETYREGKLNERNRRLGCSNKRALKK